MREWIDVTTFDEKGSGAQFPATIRVSEIVGIVDLTVVDDDARARLGLTGVNAAIKLRNEPQAMLTAETRAQIKELIG